MSKEIQLTQGKVSIVDDEDFERLSKHKWSAGNVRGKFHAVRSVRIFPYVNKRILMSREVVSAIQGEIVDHINGDTLNNTKANLRKCTNAENLQNRGKNKNNTSGYKGVIWSKFAKRWKAEIKVNYKSIHLGYFDSAELAAKAYDHAARTHHGSFAKTNF